MQLDLDAKGVARFDLPFEADVVDTGEERELVVVFLGGETATPPTWAMASTMRTPGMTG